MRRFSMLESEFGEETAPGSAMSCHPCGDFGVIWECSRNKDITPTPFALH